MIIVGENNCVGLWVRCMCRWEEQCSMEGGKLVGGENFQGVPPLYETLVGLGLAVGVGEVRIWVGWVGLDLCGYVKRVVVIKWVWWVGAGIMALLHMIIIAGDDQIKAWLQYFKAAGNWIMWV